MALKNDSCCMRLSPNHSIIALPTHPPSTVCMCRFTCRARLCLPRPPHLIGCQWEDGHRVASFNLPHHRVLTHSAQQLHAVYGWNNSKVWCYHDSSVTSLWSGWWADSLTSFQDEAGVCAPTSHQLSEHLWTDNEWMRQIQAYPNGLMYLCELIFFLCILKGVKLSVVAYLCRGTSKHLYCCSVLSQVQETGKKYSVYQ